MANDKKYSFDFIKTLVAVIVTGLSTWFGTQLAIQSKFAEFKEELHVFVAQEKAINSVASKDIENVQIALNNHIIKFNEVDKDVNVLMVLYNKQVKKEEE